MQTLIEFKNFVDELNQNNSRNYKLSVLDKYKHNPVILLYLDFIYNPYKITGISKKKISKQILRSDANDIFCSALDGVGTLTMPLLMKYILAHNTGRDVDVSVVQYFKSKLPEEYKDIFDSVITKSLSLGVDVLSINKYMNLIPTFNVMLANKYFDKPEVVEGKTFALTTKIDGGRIIAIKENGKVTFYTRQGQVYEGLVDLEKEMLEKLPDNICLDGEITLLDKGNLTSKDQYKQTMKITRKDGEKHGVKMLVFDCMSAEEFRKQHCETPYLNRRWNLINIFMSGKDDEYFEWINLRDRELHRIPGFLTHLSEAGRHEFTFNESAEFLNTLKFKYFTILPYLYVGNDTNEITEWLNYNIEHGEEGVMINILDAPYEFRRTSNLLKVKKMLDIDLEVVGYEEGSGNFSGMLGAFLVRYKEGNIVKVGSGFNKELRQEIWKNPDAYIGKVISVQYFEETVNQQGGISLRFPVFLDFRTDKQADY